MTFQAPGVLTGSAVTFRDGLGDRLHAIDADGCQLEVLRIRPEYLNAPGCEPALHERVARLSGLRDAGIAHVRRVGRGQTLEIVSERIEGRRLSELLAEVSAGRHDLGFSPATALIRELLAAVARLHAYGRDVAHGALAPERIVVSGRGALAIVEPVLGPAIEQLQWSRRRLWLSARIAMPQGAGLCRFDQRADLAQVGATALALLLGRPLRDEEFPDGLTLALREASDRVAKADPARATGFAGWLLKALQAEGRSFGSAKEALAALDDLLAPAVSGSEPVVADPAPRRPASQPVAEHTVPQAPAARVSPLPAPVRPREPAATVLRSPTPPPLVRAPRINVKVGVRARVRASSLLVARAAVAVVVIAGAAAGTARYCYNAAASTEASVHPAAPPEAVAPRPRPRAKVVVANPPPVEHEVISAEALVLPGAITPVPEPGWMVVSAPVDVTIYEGGRRLGELREGRLPTIPGTHQIEIVNETLGYRETRRVEVEPGQEAAVTISLPFGTVDLNATPWAEVWLAGARLGETPLGSLSLPIGPHEFIFRHPEFGERRYAISLTAADPVRLTVDMTRR
jgi:hypothetical protein